MQYGLSEKMNEGGVGYKIFRMNEIIGGRMFDGGAMKCADISVEEFAKYRLNRGDVLFNRTNGSLDHVGKLACSIWKAITVLPPTLSASFPTLLRYCRSS